MNEKHQKDDIKSQKSSSSHTTPSFQSDPKTSKPRSKKHQKSDSRLDDSKQDSGELPSNDSNFTSSKPSTNSDRKKKKKTKREPSDKSKKSSGEEANSAESDIEDAPAASPKEKRSSKDAIDGKRKLKKSESGEKSKVKRNKSGKIEKEKDSNSGSKLDTFSSSPPKPRGTRGEEEEEFDSLGFDSEEEAGDLNENRSKSLISHSAIHTHSSHPVHSTSNIHHSSLDMNPMKRRGSVQAQLELQNGTGDSEEASLATSTTNIETFANNNYHENIMDDEDDEVDEGCGDEDSDEEKIQRNLINRDLQRMRTGSASNHTSNSNTFAKYNNSHHSRQRFTQRQKSGNQIQSEIEELNHHQQQQQQQQQQLFFSSTQQQRQEYGIPIGITTTTAASAADTTSAQIRQLMLLGAGSRSSFHSQSQMESLDDEEVEASEKRNNHSSMSRQYGETDKNERSDPLNHSLSAEEQEELERIEDFEAFSSLILKGKSSSTTLAGGGARRGAGVTAAGGSEGPFGSSTSTNTSPVPSNTSKISQQSSISAKSRRQQHRKSSSDQTGFRYNQQLLSGEEPLELAGINENISSSIPNSSSSNNNNNHHHQNNNDTHSKNQSNNATIQGNNFQQSNSNHVVMDEEKVRLNVGGKYFETYVSTLRKYPNTLLGTMLHPRNAHMLTRKLNVSGVNHSDHNNNTHKNDSTYHHHHHDEATNQGGGQIELFIDRNPRIFECILDFYRTSVLNRPPDISFEMLKEELSFFQIEIPEWTNVNRRVSMDLRRMEYKDLVLPASEYRKMTRFKLLKDHHSSIVRILQFIQHKIQRKADAGHNTSTITFYSPLHYTNSTPREIFKVISTNEVRELLVELLRSKDFSVKETNEYSKTKTTSIIGLHDQVINYNDPQYFSFHIKW